MAETDRAIIVGIQTYPELGDLKGPENDARAFRDWIVDSKGGEVPKKNVQLILSSDFPVATAATSALPTVMEVQRALETIQALADASEKKGTGRRVGRRLYLYLAGHGFSPEANETALLMANAARARAGAVYHFLGTYNAGWFYRAGFFEEIFLFMDCCREVCSAPSLNKPWPDEIDPESVNRCRYFHGFGTKWSQLSRERPMPPDNKVHGVFTTALLAGLNGAAADPADPSGVITAESLESYLYDNMKEFLTPEDRASEIVPKEPDVDFKPRQPARQIIVARTAPRPQGVIDRLKDIVRTPAPAAPKFSVTFKVPVPLRGKPARVLLGIDATTVVDSIDKVPAEWTVSLERGTYLAAVDGADLKVVEVNGLQEVQDVPF
jgi:hypothetical protein